MEIIRYDQDDEYSRVIMQHGSGLDSDGYYIYNQNGEGIGSFLASLFRGALPILGSAIKGVASAATPHIKTGLKRAAVAGAEDLFNRIHPIDRKAKRYRKRKL